MDPRTLLPFLESPYAAYKPVTASAKEVVLIGLRWLNEYCSSLAITWLEQSAPIDHEVVIALEKIAATEKLSQSIRHRAFALVRRYLHQSPIAELDTVRIVALKTPNRQFDGSERIKREPRLGDKGAVVHVYPAGAAEQMFMVEAVNPEGYTLWVADFFQSELKLETKHHAST